MLRLASTLFLLWSSALVLLSGARPLAQHEELKLFLRNDPNTFNTSDFDILFQGNQAFRNDVDPQLLKDLAEHGQGNVLSSWHLRQSPGD